MSTKNKIIAIIFVVLVILNVSDFIKTDKVNITWLSGDAFLLMLIIINVSFIARIKLKLYTVGEVQSYILVDDNKKKDWVIGKKMNTVIKFSTVDKAENIAKIDSLWKEAPRIGQKVKLVLNKGNYNRSEILDESQLSNTITNTIILIGVFGYLMYLAFK